MKNHDLTGAGREISKVVVFALAVIGVIGVICAATLTLLIVFFGASGGQWG
ncbi:MAG: hypothetical protein M3323_00915 [Actinomycetota bacterium]|nr:hypothetical protein [Actinomycetota bacterium]